jgi:hypothetical protein
MKLKISFSIAIIGVIVMLVIVKKQSDERLTQDFEQSRLQKQSDESLTQDLDQEWQPKPSIDFLSEDFAQARVSPRPKRAHPSDFIIFLWGTNPLLHEQGSWGDFNNINDIMKDVYDY